jgi:hypothetical protein
MLIEGLVGVRPLFLKAAPCVHKPPPSTACIDEDMPSSPQMSTRRYMRITRWRASRLHPNMNGFMSLADSRAETRLLRDRLGLLDNPKTSLWRPTHMRDHHLGITIDLLKGEFRTHAKKLHALAKHFSALLRRATNPPTRIFCGKGVVSPSRH